MQKNFDIHIFQKRSFVLHYLLPRFYSNKRNSGAPLKDLKPVNVVKHQELWCSQLCSRTLQEQVSKEGFYSRHFLQLILQGIKPATLISQIREIAKSSSRMTRYTICDCFFGSFFQSCWPTRDHIGRSTGISNPVMTSSTGVAKGCLDHRFRAPPTYTAQLLTLHQQSQQSV